MDGVRSVKVFAFDYVANGGMLAAGLPAPPAHHGGLMLRALLDDLGAVPNVELLTMPCSRAGAAGPAAALASVAGDTLASAREAARSCAGDGFLRRFDACCLQADAVWPLAPEQGGLLEDLSRKVLLHERVLLGSRPAAVRVAGSKLLTAQTLARAGVAVVDTYPADAVTIGDLPDSGCAWVVKPEYGSGCADTRLFSRRRRALAWIQSHGGAGYVLQPFLPGKLCSLSLLCRDGLARILSCNTQRIVVADNQFHFLGTTVNGVTDTTGTFARCARGVAAAMPGLWGYVGVDLVMSNGGAIVLEVNPRMTISHAGLHASIGINPAALVLGLLDGDGAMTDVTPAQAQAMAVSVDVAAFAVS
jgi:predicted ATP-grasp superfamily ATP-dependent carboligase